MCEDLPVPVPNDAPSQPVLEIFPYVIQAIRRRTSEEYKFFQVGVHRIGVRRICGEKAVHEPLVALLPARHARHFTSLLYLHIKSTTLHTERYIEITGCGLLEHNMNDIMKLRAADYQVSYMYVFLPAKEALV